MCNDENGGKFKTKLFLAEINALCLPWAKNTHTHTHTFGIHILWRLNEETAKKMKHEVRASSEYERGKAQECEQFQKISKSKPHIVWVFICVWNVDVVDAFTHDMCSRLLYVCERKRENKRNFRNWFLLKNFLPPKQWEKGARWIVY